MPALATYRGLHHDLLIPCDFIVPQEPPWPRATHGLKLGNIASHIRSLNEWADKHDELEGLGFKFGDVLEAIWRTEINPAFQVFLKTHGHLRIPVDFVVPSEQPWSEASYGLDLGNIVQTIRSHGMWGGRINKLEEHGLEFVENTFIDWISGTKIEEEFYNFDMVP